MLNYFIKYDCKISKFYWNVKVLSNISLTKDEINEK
jgi:hypothetical protein